MYTPQIRRLLLLSCAIFCLGVAREASAKPSKPDVEAAREAVRLAYEGHQAIERQDWLAAAASFRKLERTQRKANEPTDAALYWQAYALTQAHRDGEVRLLVDQLLEAYPESAWADDARALAQDPEPAKVAEGATDATREEDALMALDALLSSSSQRAVPILKKVLAGDHSEKVKARALFVLTQIDPDAGAEALNAILVGRASVSLKKEAIRMVAAGARRSTLDRLLPLYRDSDEQIRGAIIEGWIIGSRGDLLRKIAEQERDPALRRRAIEAIGAVNDRASLVELYGALADRSAKLDVLQGLGIAGAQSELAAIVKSSKDPELKAQALKALGMSGGKGVAEMIAAFYDDADVAVRRAVIQGLIMCEGGKQLAQLYRRERDRTLKHELLKAMTAVGDEEVLDEIQKVLER